MQKCFQKLCKNLWKNIEQKWCKRLQKHYEKIGENVMLLCNLYAFLEQFFFQTFFQNTLTIFGCRHSKLVFTASQYLRPPYFTSPKFLPLITCRNVLTQKNQNLKNFLEHARDPEIRISRRLIPKIVSAC